MAPQETGMDLGSVADWLQVLVATGTMLLGGYFLIDRRRAEQRRIRVSPWGANSFKVQFRREDETEELLVRVIALAPPDARVREMDVMSYDPRTDTSITATEAPPAAREITLRLARNHDAPLDELSARFRVVTASSGSKLKVIVLASPSGARVIDRTIHVTITS